MGKKLIIKNADFSINAINSDYDLTIGFSEDTFTSAENLISMVYTSYVDSRYANLYNKHISLLEFKVARAGIISIIGFKNNTQTDKAAITFTEDMVGKKVKIPVSIDVADGEMICFVKSTDTGAFYWCSTAAAAGYNIYSKAGKANVTPILLSDRALCINIYTS